MSLAITKTNFEQLIDDRNNGVIALSGKWGTGKSHMWRQVQKDSTNEAIKKALYVSLFGVKDILQLKLRIVQSAIPDSKNGHLAREVVTGAIRQAIKFAKGFNPAFSALDEIALLAVPAILRNRVIVIDDIERKHMALSIEEVMGFIDEFTQIYGARILLILNSDQLADKGMWDKLREKVIDHEIALETTPEEAFDIAIQNIPSPYASRIREVAKVCKITNIRIIQKIIRAVDRLLSIRSDLTGDVLGRVVPSTVLLAAIHYKGLHDGPDFDYVLRFNSMAYHLSKVGKTKAVDDETDKDRLEVKWSQLMSQLGISAADEYEELVAAFLKSGLLDSFKTNAIFDKYVAEKEMFAFQARFREFFEKGLWHPECSDVDLLTEATTLVADIHLLSAYDVTALHGFVRELCGGAGLAERVVADWLAHFRQNPPVEFNHDSFFRRELHPDIEAEFEVLRKRCNPPPTLFEVCTYLTENAGWGEAQESAMKAATPAMFETEITGLTGTGLKKFMLKNIDIYINHMMYERHFGDAMWNFVAACRAICYENASPRRTLMIRRVFDASQLVSLMAVHDHPQSEAAPVPGF